MLRTQTPRLSEIQSPVRDLLDPVVAELRRIVLADFPAVNEVNDHLLWSRGKLFRPTLLLLSNMVGGRANPRAVTLAAVVELVHLATLVHDDAVDHSVLRRGMPTVNALWNHQTAVIMGDYLYSRSITELARFARVDFIDVLSRAANEMSVGELRQLASHDALRFTEEDYARLIASTAVMGKPSGQDLREHKVTLPLIHALTAMAGGARREVEHFFVEPVTSDDGIARIIELVQEHGGIDYAYRKAGEYGEQAAEALVGLPENEATEALREAVLYVVHRRR
jgi:octaprenyl-diphosphate synthase